MVAEELKRKKSGIRPLRLISEFVVGRSGSEEKQNEEDEVSWFAVFWETSGNHCSANPHDKPNPHFYLNPHRPSCSVADSESCHKSHSRY